MCCLHQCFKVGVALKRTWDISVKQASKVNLAISGDELLTFMTIRLFQFVRGFMKTLWRSMFCLQQCFTWLVALKDKRNVHEEDMF